MNDFTFWTLIAVFVIGMTLLILCPSRAALWEWVEFEGRIRKEAQRHMDAERATRKAIKLRDAEWERMHGAEERKERVSA